MRKPLLVIFKHLQYLISKSHTPLQQKIYLGHIFHTRGWCDKK